MANVIWSSIFQKLSNYVTKKSFQNNVFFIIRPIKNIFPFPLKRRSGSGYGDEDHGNEQHRART